MGDAPSPWERAPSWAGRGEGEARDGRQGTCSGSRSRAGQGGQGSAVCLTVSPRSGGRGAGGRPRCRRPAAPGPGGAPAEARHRGAVLHQHLLPLPAGELLQLGPAGRPLQAGGPAPRSPHPGWPMNPLKGPCCCRLCGLGGGGAAGGGGEEGRPTCPGPGDGGGGGGSCPRPLSVLSASRTGCPQACGQTGTRAHGSTPQGGELLSSGALTPPSSAPLLHAVPPRGTRPGRCQSRQRAQGCLGWSQPGRSEGDLAVPTPGQPAGRPGQINLQLS